MSDELLFEQLAEQDDSLSQHRAPSRLKSRAYTALIRAQQASGPLLDVSSTKSTGSRLCVFEELVQITPIGQPVKSKFYCHVCHARRLAEGIENAPIWWPHCPYVQFQNR